jgi:hypothetical protein
MRESVGVLVFCAVVSMAGCSSSSTTQPSTTNQTASPAQAAAATPAVSTASPVTGETPAAITAKPKVDACTLLTSDEIKAVQGEPVKDTKTSDRAAGDFLVTQCYYELPTTSNSISLTLTEGSGKTGAQSIKDYWEETFGKNEKTSEREKERKKGTEKAKPERGGEEEEESAPLEPVRGIGDEAFWSASRVGGALYVIKRDHYIRISVGGKDNIETKLKKSKSLAQKALGRL